MAEAHARMHLRDMVLDIDVDVAISIMLNSFIQSQKFSVANQLRKKFGHYLTFREDVRGLILSLIDRLYRERVHLQLYLRLKFKHTQVETETNQ